MKTAYVVKAFLYLKAEDPADALAEADAMMEELQNEHDDYETGEHWLDSWTLDGVKPDLT